MIQFLMYFSQISMELSRLLGVKFIPGRGLEGPVGRILKSVIKYNNEKSYDLRDRQLTKLALFVGELSEIEKSDPALLRSFRNIYKKSGMDYFGFRLEVATTALLIRKKMQFLKRESPDFSIRTPEGDEVYVECGSAHLSKPKTKDVAYKISSVLNGKIREPYMNPKTALFIDITNIIFSSLESKFYLDQNTLTELITTSMRGKPLGIVCLLFYLFEKDRQWFSHQCVRVDNEGAHSSIIATMDSLLPPQNQGFTTNYEAPSAG